MKNSVLKKLTFSQKASLFILLLLVIALPLAALAAFNPVKLFKKAAGDPTCKTGVNTFVVDTPCGEGNYRYMTFACFDGFGRREGGPTSCKSSSIWLSYAESYCAGRSSCIVPVPTASPTPNYPTVTPRPTTSYPTVTPPPAYKPTIITNLLPEGNVLVNYKATIKGSQVHVVPNTGLTMSITGLPSGFYKNCSSSTVGTGTLKTTTATCTITGKPTSSQARLYTVMISLKDTFGQNVVKSLQLRINGRTTQ